jgi:hypothetical protein
MQGLEHIWTDRANAKRFQPGTVYQIGAMPVGSRRQEQGCGPGGQAFKPSRHGARLISRVKAAGSHQGDLPVPVQIQGGQQTVLSAIAGIPMPGPILAKGRVRRDDPGRTETHSANQNQNDGKPQPAAMRPADRPEVPHRCPP